jgi:hypothetical protein
MRRPEAMTIAPRARSLGLLFLVATFAMGCGGTTGQEQPPGPSPTNSADATTDAFPGSAVDGSVDAAAANDSGYFDVDIAYAEASRLPDVVAPPATGGGSEAGTAAVICSVDAGQVCGGQDGGVCTPTECLFYRFSPVCYQALIDNGCLDDEQGDMNNECSDLLLGQTTDPMGVSRSQRCLDVIRCTLAHASAQPLLDFGYCGVQPTSTSCTMPSGQNGPCLSTEQLGLESIDPPTVLSRYTATTFGGGMGNRIFNCAIVNLASDMNLQTCLTLPDAGP